MIIMIMKRIEIKSISKEFDVIMENIEKIERLIKH